MTKRALITGITGQTGSYLAELLFEKGYEVHGLVRKASTFSTERIDHIFPHPTTYLHYGDVMDALALNRLVADVKPDELYHLAAQSHVQVSFDLPWMTGVHTGLSTTALLEAVRIYAPTCRFYQASSSEIFGGASSPQSHKSLITPRSPYAAAKAYAFTMTRMYREAYGLYAVNGVLFNHESPRRSPTFVTRKISQAIAEMALRRRETVALGNLSAQRDWGFAGDYARAIWLMMQYEEPRDWTVATGESYSVDDFLYLAARHADVFRLGTGSWDDWLAEHVEIDQRYMRPLEVNLLRGDATETRELLGWEPEVAFSDLVKMMVDEDLSRLRVNGR